MGVEFVTICRISGKHACRLGFLGAQATIFCRVNCIRFYTEMLSVLRTSLGARRQERQMAAKFATVCQHFHQSTHISPLSGRCIERFKLH